ncbi:MAG: excinuclease ABC subunit C [Methanotrichaceae archaeon]|nr:excinuclease ABC subunit C [Methanotrichaceae archaeon]
MLSASTLPHLPGCYLFKDSEGLVLYVGKARDLKKRVSSYLNRQDHDPKTAAMLESAESVDFIVTNNEVEALILENTLIKRHTPRYNIKLKDSSRYASIQLTDESFPRICISRKSSGKGTFSGPFVSARERDYVLSLLRRTFGLRTCKRLPKRACLRYHMGACSGPCIGQISEADYRERVKRAESVLRGRTRELLASLKEQMKEAAELLEYERALELRSQIGALERMQERQHVEQAKKHDQDILSYKIEGGQVYLMLFKVYRGTLEEKQDFIFAWSENFVEEFLVQYYSENDPPEELILEETVDESLAAFLSHRKKKTVKVTVPKQGEKKELLELAERNVEAGFFGDRKKIEALQEALRLDRPPEVIDCFDISHLMGSATVGSMVQFRGGRPDKSQYRRFKIREVAGIDDFASIAEVVRRRYSRLKKEMRELPDLIIIDGGQGQLNSAQKELDKLGVWVPVISIAKGEEEIYVPGLDQPLPINRNDRASLFVQEIRDEAHRFAIAYHRLLRQKALRT